MQVPSAVNQEDRSNFFEVRLQCPRNNFCCWTIGFIRVTLQAIVNRICAVLNHVWAYAKSFLPTEKSRGLRLPVKNDSLTWESIKTTLEENPNLQVLKISGLKEPVPRYILENYISRDFKPSLSKLMKEKEIVFCDGTFFLNGFIARSSNYNQCSFTTLLSDEGKTPLQLPGYSLEAFNELIKQCANWDNTKNEKLVDQDNCIAQLYLSYHLNNDALRRDCADLINGYFKKPKITSEDLEILKYLTPLLAVDDLSVLVDVLCQQYIENCKDKQELSKTLDEILSIQPRTLDLSKDKCKLNDAHMEQIGECPSLTSLSLYDQENITSEGYACLKGLTALEFLNLSSSSIKGEDVINLASFPLTTLSLAHNDKIGNKGMEVMPSLKSLTRLDLTWTEINDGGIPNLIGAQRLESLRLWGAKITDKGLTELKKLEHLKDLDLGCCPFTKQDWIEILSEFPALKKVNLNHKFKSLDVTLLEAKGIEVSF